MPQRPWIRILLLFLCISLWTIGIRKRVPARAAEPPPSPTVNSAVARAFQDSVLIALNNPVTVKGNWPTPAPMPPKRTVVASTPRKAVGQCLTYTRAVTGIYTGSLYARDAMKNAAKKGYTVSTEVPKEGGLIQTSESKAGHVGIIRKVEGNSITIEERNYAGPGVIGTRVLDVDDPVVQGFIHPNP